jgi:hypothetical protein
VTVRLVDPIVGLELECLRLHRTANPQELEDVPLIHLMDQLDGFQVGGAAGGGPGVLTTLPQTERQTFPTVGGQSLEIPDEPG